LPFVPVRLEDDRGRVARNHYAWRTPHRGPPVPRRTTEEWIANLTSGAAVDRLAALVWLTGRHLPSQTERQANCTQESVEDSECFEAARDDPRVAAILGGLREHRNRWVRECAKAGLAPTSEQERAERPRPARNDAWQGTPGSIGGDRAALRGDGFGWPRHAM